MATVINGSGDSTFNGNIIQLDSSPEYHFATDSATHYNWRIAAQEQVNGGFEIASGTQTAGSNASSDTYTNRLVIDSAGRVTMPYQPAWRVGMTSNQTLSPNTTYTVTLNQASGDGAFLRGVTLNNNQITVPVGGIYWVQFSARSESQPFGTVDIYIKKNGETIQRWYQNQNTVSNYQEYGPIATHVELAANDVLDVVIWSTNGGQLSNLANDVVSFSGHLVG